MVVMQAER